MWALVFSFFSGWFVRFLGGAAVRYLAFKIIAYLLFVTILPVILYNVFSYIIGEVLQLVQSYGGSIQPIVIQLSGLSGYLAQQFRLPEALSLVLSAILFRVTMKIVTFGRI